MSKTLTKKQIIEGANYVSPWAWAKHSGLIINKQPFNLRDHPYQLVTMERKKRVVVRKWAAQIGKTLGTIIHELHHLIYDYYPQGAMFIFPHQTLVERFSKSRFTPMIEDNPFLQQYIRSTDTIELKRVAKSNLYFVGGKPTAKIAGEQKTSAAVKSEPVDSLNFDEFDEIDPDIAMLTLDRIGHSEIKNESYTSTPSIPDWGIDKLYQDSTQGLWMIKCRHCNTETCLELEFPEIIREDSKSKRWRRACKKCGREIYTIDGRWVEQYPDRDVEGTWISRLNLADKYVDLGKIVQRFMNPPQGNLGLVMNGDLGMSYIAAENRLTVNDLLAIMGNEPMPLRHSGPTAMGVDVGNDFHVVIVDKPYEKSVRLVKAVRLNSRKMTDFSPLHDLIVQYKVRSCVIDFAPAQQKVRAFREEERGTGCEIFGNIYQEQQRGVINFDSKEGIVRENRTEISDQVHDMVVTPGRMIFPRRSEEINEVVKHFCNLVKVQEEDSSTGSKEFHYRRTGPDHYRHAMHYAVLAASRIGVYVPPKVLRKRQDAWDEVERPKGRSWMAS